MTDGNTKTFESSALQSATYDPGSQVLSIKFKDSGVYDYEGVPADVWDGLCNCKSAGKYVNENLRGKFAKAGEKEVDYRVFFKDEQTGRPAKGGKPALRPASEARKP